jgi:hypothetical protein
MADCGRGSGAEFSLNPERPSRLRFRYALVSLRIRLGLSAKFQEGFSLVGRTQCLLGLNVGIGNTGSDWVGVGHICRGLFPPRHRSECHIFANVKRH